MVGKHPIVLDKPIFPYSHDLLLLHTHNGSVISPYYIPINDMYIIYTQVMDLHMSIPLQVPGGGAAAAALRRAAALRHVVAAAAVVADAPGADALAADAVGDAWRWRHFWVNLGINGNMDGLE